MRLEVFGVGDEQFGVDEGDEGARCEVTCLPFLGGEESVACVVVLAVFGFDVVVKTLEFLGRVSWGLLAEGVVGSRTFRKESMSSAMGLSARYLILFHEKVWRYWATGSEGPCQQPLLVTPNPYRHALSLTFFDCCILSLSPSSIPANESPILPTTASQSAASLARSSA